MSEIIGFSNAIFWTDDTDILYCEFSNNDPSLKLNIDNVESYINAIIKLCNGKPMPFLINLKGTRGTFSVTAAKFVAKSPELMKLRISESYLINSMGIKLLIGFYKRLYDPVTPFGIFNEMDLALDYCKETKGVYYGSN